MKQVFNYLGAVLVVVAFAGIPLWLGIAESKTAEDCKEITLRKCFDGDDKNYYECKRLAKDKCR